VRPPDRASIRCSGCRCDGTVIAESIANCRSSRAHPPSDLGRRSPARRFDGGPRAPLGRGQQASVPRFCRSSNANVKADWSSCTAHMTGRDIAALAAIDFMLHRRDRFASFTSESVFRRFRRGRATRSKFRQQLSLGGSNQGFGSSLAALLFLPAGRGQRVTCSRSRRPRALRRVFLPKLSPSGGNPQRLTTADSASVHRRGQIFPRRGCAFM
jgi:hypothetical protein